MNAVLKPFPERCRVCGSTQSTYWGAENGYTAVRCADCDLVYLNPWPNLAERDKALQYGAHAGDRTVNTTHRPNTDLIPQYRKVLGDVFGRFDKPVRWLDVGCGYGEFLLSLKEIAPAASMLQGSEPNVTKTAWAKSQGLDVSYRELGTIREKFTHVSLLNVFSHLPDPIDFLAQCRDLLEPGGELLIQTGNGGDIERRDFPGELWFPDHLTFASRKTLGVVIDKLGMTTTSLTDYHYPALTPVNVAKDLAKRLLRRGRYNAVSWTGPFRTLWVRLRVVD